MQILLFIALILMLCLFSSRLLGRVGVPTLLVFIVLGMVFGTDGILKIPLDDYQLVEHICSVSLAFIMFYGGFGTNWAHAKPVAGKSIALSSVGVVVTALITAIFCQNVLCFGKEESLLIGAVISSTDAASVFSILRSKKLNLKDNTASLLELESGSNDPASYMLTLIALNLIAGTAGKKLIGVAILQIVLGVVLGVLVAIISIWILKKKRFAVDGYNTLFVFAMVIIAYAGTTLLQGNGYLAVYLFGILLGNSPIVDKVPLVHFFDGVTGQVQIIIFFLLGLLAYPSRIPTVFLSALAITLCLTLIARPISVFMILGPSGCSMRQILLVSFAGLRGAASIVFAIIAIVSGADIRWDLFHIVFCVCLLSILFQGSLLPIVAKKLDMIDDNENVMKTFNDYQVEQQLQLAKCHISEGHPWTGKCIGELNIELDVLIVMIIRGRKNLVPRGDTIIEAEDLVIFGGIPYWDTTDVTLEEIRLDFRHPWVGQQIRELPLVETDLVVLIRHADDSTEIPHGDTLVRNGDTLVIRNVQKVI